MRKSQSGRKRKRVDYRLEEAMEAAQLWFAEYISADEGSDLAVDNITCIPISQSSFLLGPIARLADRHNCLRIAVQSGPNEIPGVRKLVWGMAHGRDVDWESLGAERLLEDFVELARVTDHPAVRSPVVRGAVLSNTRQRGSGGPNGWLCQHIESGIDDAMLERAHSRFESASPMSYASEGSGPGSGSPSLLGGGNGPGSGSGGSLARPTPRVLASLRHPDRILRLAYRLARAGRLQGRLERQSKAASSAEMLYGLPLPPVRGLTGRERGFLTHLPRTLRDDQLRSLSFLREIEHDGCVVRAPPSAAPTEHDLCTTESAASAWLVDVPDLPLLMTENLPAPASSPRPPPPPSSSSSSSSSQGSASAAPASPRRRRGRPSTHPSDSEAGEPSASAAGAEPVSLCISAPSAPLGPEEEHGLSSAAVTVRLWCSPSVKQRPRLHEIFGGHRMNYFFRKIPFSFSRKLAGLRGTPTRAGVSRRSAHPDADLQEVEDMADELMNPQGSGAAREGQPEDGNDLTSRSAGPALFYNAVGEAHVVTDSDVRRRWLLNRWKGGGVLASEMGLGKTSVACSLVYLDVIDPARSSGRVMQAEAMAARLNVPIVASLQRAGQAAGLYGLGRSQEEQEDHRQRVLAGYLGAAKPESTTLAHMNAVAFGVPTLSRMPKHPNSFGSRAVVDSAILSSIVSPQEDEDGDVDDDMSECSVEFVVDEGGKIASMQQVILQAIPDDKSSHEGDIQHRSRSKSKSRSKFSAENPTLSTEEALWPPVLESSAGSDEMLILGDSDDDDEFESSHAAMAGGASAASMIQVQRPKGWASTAPVVDKQIQRRGPVSVQTVSRRIGLVPSNATLVVVDSVLLDQWIREIRATVGDRLRVHVYCGISQTGNLQPGTQMEKMLRAFNKRNRATGSAAMNHPTIGRQDSNASSAEGSDERQHAGAENTDAIADKFAVLSEASMSQTEKEELLLLRQLRSSGLLADGEHRLRLSQLECLAMCNSDIVLATYATLRQEFALSKSARRSGRVKPEVETAPPVTPLRKLQFRRMIIDEAQQVAQSSSALGVLMRMLNNIEAERRWCVSATPLGDDSLPAMLGLLRFLRHPLLGDVKVWQQVAEPLLGLGSLDATVEMLKYLVETFFYRQDQSAVEALFLPRHTFVVRVQPTTAERERIREIEGRAQHLVHQVARAQIMLQGRAQLENSAAASAKQRSGSSDSNGAMGVALAAIPRFVEINQEEMSVKDAARHLAHLAHKISYARGGRDSKQQQSQEELLRGIRIRCAQQHEGIRRQLCWRWQHLAEVLIRTAAGIRQSRHEEYVAIKDLTALGWTVPRVSLSAEGFLSSDPPQRTAGVEPAEVGCWLDADLVYRLGSNILGARQAAVVARTLRFESSITRASAPREEQQLQAASRVMPMEISSLAAKRQPQRSGDMFADLELGARQLLGLLEATGNGTTADPRVFDENGWSPMIFASSHDAVEDTFLTSFGDGCVFAHQRFNELHGVRVLDEQLDDLRQKLLAEISSRVVRSRTQQLQNADIEYADVRDTGSRSQTWQEEDQYDSLASGLLHQDLDSPSTDDEVEAADGQLDLANSEANEEAKLEQSLPFQDVKSRWSARLRRSINHLAKRIHPEVGFSRGTGAESGIGGASAVEGLPKGAGRRGRSKHFLGMHSVASNLKDIATDSSNPVGPTVLRLHRGMIGDRSAAAFWAAVEARKDHLARVRSIFDQMHPLLIHMLLLPRLLLIDRQESPETVMVAAQTFISPPTLFSEELKHRTPDGADGREHLWDASWGHSKHGAQSGSSASSQASTVADDEEGDSSGIAESGILHTEQAPAVAKQSTDKAGAAAGTPSLSAAQLPRPSSPMEDGHATSIDSRPPPSTTVASNLQGKEREVLHPLAEPSLTGDLQLQIDTRGYCILAAFRAALQCYREAQDVEVDRETLEDEERGTLQWSLLEMRNNSLLQAIARAAGQLDWQEECRRQKRRTVHMVLSAKARIMRRHFHQLTELVKTSYGISSSFAVEAEGDVDGMAGVHTPAILPKTDREPQNVRQHSRGSGSGDVGSSAMNSGEDDDDDDDDDDDITGFSGKQRRHPGVPEYLHSWLNGMNSGGASREAVAGTPSSLPVYARERCSKLQRELTTLAESTATLVLDSLRRTVSSNLDKATRKWLQIELDVMTQRWELIRPSADRKPAVRSIRKLEQETKIILKAGQARLEAAFPAGSAPFPLSKTRPRLLNSQSVDAIPHFRARIDASVLQATTLSSIRSAGAAMHRELRKICGSVDYVTDLCSAFDPSTHSDADSGRWDDAGGQFSNQALIGLVTRSFSGVASDLFTKSGGGSDTTAQRGGSGALIGKHEDEPTTWHKKADLKSNLSEISDLESKAMQTYNRKKEQDSKFALLQKTLSEGSSGGTSRDLTQEQAEQLGLPVCAISGDVPRVPVMTPCCGSTFELEHLEHWMQQKKVCPLCRSALARSQFISLLTSTVAEESGIFHVSHRNALQQVQTLKAAKSALLAQGKLNQHAQPTADHDRDDLDHSSSEEEEEDEDEVEDEVDQQESATAAGRGSNNPALSRRLASRSQRGVRHQDTEIATGEIRQILLDPRPGAMPAAPWERRTQVPARLLTADYVPPADSGTSNREKVGDMTAKVAVLVRRIKALPVTEQAVVFVHDSSIANFILRALVSSGIQSIGINGTEQQQRDSMRQFADGTAKALVLDYMRGAKGLTLNQANNVFLVDSALPHTEAQAVSRVWRFGQQKQVNVFRIVIEDSMEERMLLSKDAAPDRPGQASMAIEELGADGGAGVGEREQQDAGAPLEALLKAGLHLEPDSVWQDSPAVQCGDVEIKSIGDLAFIAGARYASADMKQVPIMSEAPETTAAGGAAATDRSR